MVNYIPETVGSYRILGSLGQGGMGIVYQGQHQHTGAIVALKTVRMQKQITIQSIRREIHALAQLNHPGIIKIVAEGIQDNIPWYAMEFIDGTTLLAYCAGMHHPNGSSPDTVQKDSAPDTSPIHSQPDCLTETTPGWWTGSICHVRTAQAGDSFGQTQSQEYDFAETERPQSGSMNNLPPVTHLTEDRLRSILTIIRGLCAPLAFIHGEGIIHRDLKPENVMVKSDGRPVIVDFGLLSRFRGADISRDLLHIEASTVGTLYYIAPEQIENVLVDARADLYSLGCIIYELFAGHPPFLKKSGEDILKAHMYEAPLPLSKFIPAVPAELDELVLALLAKNPRDRVGYAADVARVLENLGMQHDLFSQAPKPRSYLYRPGFAGRQNQLAQLKFELKCLQNKKGGVVLIGGESGVGKTRLILEFGREIVNSGYTIFIGECLDVGARPLEALRKPLQAIADFCREKGTPETDRIFGERGKVLAIFESSLRGLPGQEVYPDPTPLTADAARQRLYRYLTRTFEIMAQEQPVILIIDDLQWADNLTLGYLEYISGQLQIPLLILGTYRIEELEQDLERILDLDVVHHLELNRLDESAISAMLQDMLAWSRPPPAFATFLSRHTEGNPFFIAEYLLVAVDEALLFRDESGNWIIRPPENISSREMDFGDLPLPHSLRSLVGRRIKGMSDRALAVMNASAIVGRETNLQLLPEMTSSHETRLMEAIEELLRRRVLEDTGSDSVRFVHDKIREVAVLNMNATERTVLHKKAALGIEKIFAQDRESYLPTLGYHWEQAGDFEKAQKCYLFGGRKALRDCTFEEGERLFLAYMNLVDEITDQSIRARVYFGAAVRQLLGRHEEAIQEYKQAISEARAVGEQKILAEGMIALGKAYNETGQMDKSLQCFEDTHKIAAQLNIPEILKLLSCSQGMVFYNLGRYDEARQSLKQCLTLARQLHDKMSLGQGLSNLGLIYQARGEYKKARQLYERGTNVSQAGGDPWSAGTSIGNLAGLYCDLGHLKKSIELSKEALNIARQFNDRRNESLVLGNLTNVFRIQGWFDEARDFCSQALVIAREMNNKNIEACLLSDLARINHDLGHVEKAEAIYQQALPILHEIDDRKNEAHLSANLGLIRMDQGLLTEARILNEKAMNIFKDTGERRGVGICLANLAHLERIQSGNMDKALQLAREAVSIFDKMGAKMNLAELCCKQGHIMLAIGTNGRSLLDQAHTLIKDMGLTSRSVLHICITRFQQAVEALQDNKKDYLFRGELIEHIPLATRRWLVKSGQLPPERAFLEGTFKN
ncbi:tetratricopeptide repeat protein [candidate division CSSED10-310 bacterium]|uniref:Tetratricopeptide repeat protein n=1 Tax=candidate division CSSED10-310 bacterium TaxID=2855610 RepID=A0ABV6Z0T2_UNCC1